MLEKLNGKNEHLIEVFKEQITELKEELASVNRSENVAPNRENVQDSWGKQEVERFALKIRDLE